MHFVRHYTEARKRGGARQVAGAVVAGVAA
jgi:hypothetical protein